MTQTELNNLKLIAADPRIANDRIGRAVIFGIAIMLKRGIPPARVKKFCELTIKLWGHYES